MKTTLSIIALILWRTALSQPITLPIYQEKKHENNTIYEYYGALPFTGIGSIKLSDSLVSSFITGVDFKIVIDSTNMGLSQSHSAFRDSSGVLIPVYQGDTINIPASFKLYAGEIGFRIIIEGIPQIAGESYLCDLAFSSTTGDNWNLLISEISKDSCSVDQTSSLNEKNGNQRIKIFPNPFKKNTIIKFKNDKKESCKFVLFNLIGKKVKTITNINSNELIFEKEDLPIGTYIFIIQNKHKNIASGKLIISK